jgi:hypothetical protein
MRIVNEFRGREFHELALDLGRLARREPGAAGDAKICVSTAIVGWPKATLSTTLAVFRPTPES